MEGDGGSPSVATDSGNPLLRAVFLRRLRLTRLLLDGGAYINESDGQGRTPLMVACGTQHADAQSASRVKLVQFLLEKGADPNIQDKDGRSALMHACREQAGPEVASLLLAGGADVSLEDRTGTSALVYAVMAGDLKVLKLLLDTCKARGKEVIIIATETFPCGRVQARQFLSVPPLSPPEQTPAAPASPSQIELVTSSPRPPNSVFSFKERPGCGVSSHPGSPSRPPGRAPGRAPASGPQLPLLRLNSEPWLKVPAALLSRQLQAVADGGKDFRQTAERSLAVPQLQEGTWADERLVSDGGGGDKQQISLPGLLLSHSASHPDLHCGALTATPSLSAGRHLHSLASSSLRSVIHRRRLGADIYSSDPQLAAGVRVVPDEQKAGEQSEAKRLAPLCCSSTLGAGGAPSGPGRRNPFGYERRGSGAFLLDHGSQSRPRSLPPLNNILHPKVCHLGSGPRGLLPSAPPGQPKEPSRRTLLRRHSMQTEGTA